MEDGGGNTSYGKGSHCLPWNYWESGASTGASSSDWNGFLQPPFVDRSDETHLMMVYHPQGRNAHHAIGGGESAHLTCLNLGKRHYFEDGGEVLGLSGKRGRGTAAYHASSSSLVSVPRCQVEGCHVTLTDAKDYHRRHKVCEVHSKAPKVVVLGIEQRFCQQCSRFHVVSEFDDSKRSCRRRLAGHNERRRKSANEFITRNPSQESSVMDDRFSSISSMTGCALSLLSSKTSWISSADLSSRSSAALRELIAENRATIHGRQLFAHHDLYHAPDNSIGRGCQGQEYLTHLLPQQHQLGPEVRAEACRMLPGWSHFHEPTVHVTLDLMQTPESSFEFMSGRSPPKEDECCEIWKSLEGTHVV